MSTRWYLNVCKGGKESKTRRPLGDVAAVTQAMNSAFAKLEWKSSTDAVCPDKNFSLQLGVEKGLVQYVLLAVGTTGLKKLTAICKKEGWRLEDPDVESGKDVDLDDPEGWWMEHYG